MMRTDVLIRGIHIDVIVDKYHDDHDTNSCEIEWHFDGLTPKEHEDLALTDAEEDAVIAKIQAVMSERR